MFYLVISTGSSNQSSQDKDKTGSESEHERLKTGESHITY